MDHYPTPTEAENNFGTYVKKKGVDKDYNNILFVGIGRH
jgi:hypothetical protein